MTSAALQTLELSNAAPPHLPPHDAWKVDPNRLEKFYVPVDDRGFVKPEAAIESVLRLFDEGYEWPVDWSKDAPHIFRPDDHHFHWIAARYNKKLYSGKYASVPAKFRDLPTNRGILPRQFHNVVHKWTLPPEVPQLDYMVHYLKSFEIARQLFQSAERAMRLNNLFDEASSEYDLERYVKRYDEIYKSYTQTKYKALGLQALSVIGEKDVNIESYKEVYERLGSCALLNTPNYTRQYFSRSSQ